MWFAGQFEKRPVQNGCLIGFQSFVSFLALPAAFPFTVRGGCSSSWACPGRSRRRLWCSRSFAYDGLRGAALPVLSLVRSAPILQEIQSKETRGFPASDRKDRFTGPMNVLGIFRGSLGLSQSGRKYPSRWHWKGLPK